MTTKNHIQSKTQILAGLVAGGMMGVAFILPGTASADESARPLGQVESSVFAPASTNHAIDMDIIEPSFYDEKLISNSVAHGDDMDLLDPGFYDAKLISASSMEKRWRRPYENVAAKRVRTGNSYDMDLIDPGFYDSKVTLRSNGIESLQEDNII